MKEKILTLSPSEKGVERKAGPLQHPLNDEQLRQMANLAEDQRGRKFVDIANRQFGRLVALAFIGRDQNRQCFWVCRCQCGRQTQQTASNLAGGRVRSCGCLAREETIRRFTTHGMGNKRVREYRIWANMKTRCNNPNALFFKDYGGRGIKICKRWNSFANFFKDMGPRPSGMQIERINNAIGYRPSNCIWATPKAQSNNRRNNHFVTFNGCRRTLAQWSEATGISVTTLRRRLQIWPMEKAFSTPVRK